MVSQRVTRFPEGFQCNAQLQEQFARHRLHFITCPLLVSLSLSPSLFSSPSPFLLSPALSRHRISLSLPLSLSLSASLRSCLALICFSSLPLSCLFRLPLSLSCLLRFSPSLHLPLQFLYSQGVLEDYVSLGSSSGISPVSSRERLEPSSCSLGVAIAYRLQMCSKNEPKLVQNVVLNVVPLPMGCGRSLVVEVLAAVARLRVCIALQPFAILHLF